MGEIPDPKELLVERLVREAAQRGEFDDLPGQGKPIPGAGRVDDDLWWVRRWVRRNRLEELTHPEPPEDG